MKNSIIATLVLGVLLAGTQKAGAATTSAAPTVTQPSKPVTPASPKPQGRPPLEMCRWALRDLFRSFSFLPAPKQPNFIKYQPTAETFKKNAMEAITASATAALSAPKTNNVANVWRGSALMVINDHNPLGLTTEEFTGLLKKLEVPDAQLQGYLTAFNAPSTAPVPYGSMLPEEPVYQKLSDQPETFRELLLKLKDITPAVALQNVIPLINDLPLTPPVKKKLDNMAEKVSEILLEDTASYYQTGSIAGSNMGLITYIRRQLEADPVYLRDALKFYSALKIHDIQTLNEPNTEVPAVWDRGDFDVWSMALKICDNDPRRAIRVLGVYGHDEMANQLPLIKNSPLNPAIKVLSLFTPTPQSALYMPGSIPNTNIDARIVVAIKGFKAQYDALRPGGKFYGETFRAGQYHVIGAAFVAEELVSAGYGKAAGFKLPVIVNAMLGYAYKYIVMPSEAGPDAHALYNLGFYKPGKVVEKPKGWDDNRFALAKVMLENYWQIFELTVWDHYLGANWAYHLMRKTKGSTQNFPVPPVAVLPVPPPPPPPPAPAPAPVSPAPSVESAQPKPVADMPKNPSA